MTTEQYDQLLAEIRKAWEEVQLRTTQLGAANWHLESLLKRLDTEEHRIAQQALTSTHSASRKLAVGE